MSCFGGTPVALKEEYLKNTPFFLLAAETDDATILPELAKYARARAPQFRGRARVAQLGMSEISSLPFSHLVSNGPRLYLHGRSIH